MSHTIRIADDIVEHARVQGSREGRSTAEQIDHWVRVGREITLNDTASQRRTEAALAGALPISALTREEGRQYAALVRVKLHEKLQETNISEILAAQGIVTVAVDDQGRMIEHHPDGTERVLLEDPPWKTSAPDVRGADL